MACQNWEDRPHSPDSARDDDGPEDSYLGQYLARTAASAAPGESSRRISQPDILPEVPPEPKATPLPPRGQLVFGSDFECGNLGQVACIREGAYDLQIRPDSNNPRHRVWFYFGVRNHRKGQSVVFNITNLSKTKSLFRVGMTPMAMTTSKPSWERLPSRTCFYYRSPRHSMNYVLSFVYTFETEGDVHYFAYCYPYTYTQLQHYLHLLEARDLPFLQRSLLARSLQHRRLDLLSIASPDPPPCGGKKKVVYMTARIHPGETPASFVMHGIIDFLTSPDPVAMILRRYIEFRLVPMLNPDGVFTGNYRCNPLGIDLNRYWADDGEWACPELNAVKNQCAELALSSDKELAMFIDIHAHSTNLNAFCFANMTSSDPKELEKEVHFLRLLDLTAREFSLSASRFCMDASKAGTGRRALQDLLSGITGAKCYTLETSFFAYQSFGSQPVPFTQPSYVELGRNVGRTFIEYFKLPKPHSREGQALLRKAERR